MAHLCNTLFQKPLKSHVAQKSKVGEKSFSTLFRPLIEKQIFLRFKAVDLGRFFFLEKNEVFRIFRPPGTVLARFFAKSSEAGEKKHTQKHVFGL